MYIYSTVGPKLVESSPMCESFVSNSTLVLSAVSHFLCYLGICLAKKLSYLISWFRFRWVQFLRQPIFISRIDYNAPRKEQPAAVVSSFVATKPYKGVPCPVLLSLSISLSLSLSFSLSLSLASLNGFKSK
jgi:hypothetical protein